MLTSNSKSDKASTSFRSRDNQLETLAIAYRPKTLNDLVGQSRIKETLRNAIAGGRLKRALLFSGLHGCGKTSSARIVAKCLNCQSSPTPTVEPCGNCEECRRIDRESSLNVQEIDVAAADSPVELIRDLVKSSQTAPIQARYRIFILDECHTLNKSAQNAFLRLLENPPSHVYFILCTTLPNQLLATIRSRCLQFSFRRISDADIVARLQQVCQLEGFSYESEGLLRICRLSGGSLRDSLSLLDQISLGNSHIKLEVVEEWSGRIRESQVFDLVEAIAAGDPQSFYSQTSFLISQGCEPLEILGEMRAAFTDLQKARFKDFSQTSKFHNKKRVIMLGEKFEFEQLQACTRELTTALKDIKYDPEPERFLEVVGINLLIAREVF